MNCVKSKNLLIIRFERELSNDEIINLNKALSKEKRVSFQLEEKELLVVEMLEFLCMNSFYDLLSNFLRQREVDFKYILLTEAILEVKENETTEEYLAKFVNLSNGEFDVQPLELKFVYKSNINPLYVHIADNNEDKVIIRIMDLSEINDNFEKCYDYMNKSLNELINI